MTFKRFAFALLFVALIAGLARPAWANAIRVVVNDTQITDTQIQARANLFRLERRGNSNSARLKLASDELIEDALKIQEARRLDITITEKQVNDGFLNVARNLRVSSSNLNKILRDNGVNPETLRARLRAGLAWQAVTQAAVMPRVQISDLDLEEKAAGQVEESTSFDYMLKEVLFIIPRGSGGSASRRTAQANQYRKSFQGCGTAVDLSLSYTDAAVIDVGRRHATQLPEAIAKELAGLQEGGITKPRVTDSGVSMLAVCSKASARDLTFIKGELRQEVGTEKLQEAATDYLERLKERASISYR